MSSGSQHRDVALHALLAVVAFGLVNHIASVAFLRFDLTADRRYTLAAASREVLERLTTPVHATVWFSPDLGPPYHDHHQIVADKLAELQVASGGRLSVQIAQPTRDDAARHGFLPVQYRFRSASRAESREVYLAVTVACGDREEVVSPIASLEPLEYLLVRAIRTACTPASEEPVVGLVVGNGEPDLTAFAADHPLGRLRSQLAHGRRLVAVSLDQPVPDEVDTLVEIGATRPWPVSARYHLDQFLMRGGAAAVFLSSARPDTEQGTLTRNDVGLRPQLLRYGVRVGDGLVVDREHNEPLELPVQRGARRVRLPVAHPLLVWTRDVSPASALGVGLDRLLMPFAAPVQLVEPLGEGIDALVVARSESGGGVVPLPAGLDPGLVEAAVAGELPGAVPLAVTLAGPLRSAFDEAPLDADVPWVHDGKPARLLVVGSADMVANNGLFVENAVDWLLADPALTAIRARHVPVVPLPDLSEAQQRRLRGGMVLAPLGLLGIGAAFTRWRRSR